jgi:hypothetical protein
MAIRAIDPVLFGLRPGETVLVECGSTSSSELLLYMICRRCRGRMKPILVDDISDSFAEALTRLELMGIDLEGLSNAPVIKIGGSRDAGSVFGRVDVDKYALDFRYYSQIYEKVVPHEVVFNPVMGIHKLFVTLERHEVMRLLRNISTFVGKRSRIALYFINRDVVERYSPEILPLLEETASTVLSWEFDGNKYRLKVVKAVNAGIIGSSVSFSFKDILKA